MHTVHVGLIGLLCSVVPSTQKTAIYFSLPSGSKCSAVLFPCS